jgi:transposase-like protein
MQCPECKSEHIRKNGMNRQGKQNYVCVSCDRQFITDYNTHQGYGDEFKRECLKMYVNGMGFRAIQRVKGVHHTTIITWVKEVRKLLPNAYDPETIPEVGELDELETFVGSKKTKSGSGQQ